MVIPAICLSTNITVPTNPPAISTNHKSRTFNSTLIYLSKSNKLDQALHLIESQPPHIPNTPHHHHHHSHLLEAYSSFLHACISKKSLHHGQRLYLQLLLSRNHYLLHNPTIITKLITLYSLCGQIDEARRVFDDCDHIGESVWVAMAIGYSKNGLFKESLRLYCDMLWHCVVPSDFAFSTGLKACSALMELKLGRSVHAQIVKSVKDADQVVYNSLLKLYVKCGCFEDVLQLFDEMPDKNVVTWNSFIAGLVQRGRVFEAFEIFKKMQEEGIGFTWVTLTTVLPVCARVTAICSGKEIHAQIVKSSRGADVLVLNSLVDMYAKCGAMDYCCRVFDTMRNKDVTTWNTVINGYALSGCMIKAFELFDEMVDSGYCPDGVTFIALLSGCSHSGFINEGRNLFEKMRVHFGVPPSVEHYACLVDLLGRAGELKEALEVVKSMPMKPSGSIWGSLLNSCKLHGNVSLAEEIAKRLFDLEPNNPGNYVMLSNIYAKARMWEGVRKMREIMETRGLQKEPGCSWMQIKHRVHTFIAGGSLTFRDSDEFKKAWNELMEAMKEVGYVPDTRVVLHDVDDEMKTEWVCGHSERIATMFGLINTGAGMPVRITKNLRVCVDCHVWMKYVSAVTRRVIVLRDTNRFHIFEDGSCSCKDYW